MSIHSIAAILARGGAVLAALSVRSLRRMRKTGYGWDCPPCRIRAGHPGDPLPDYGTACAALIAHVESAHDNQMPQDTEVVEIVWR